MFAHIGLAAPDLFAALLVAIVFAVAGIGPARPSRPVVMLSQGMLAVTIGLSVQRETLTTLGSHWPAVVTVAIATVVLSVLAGLMLSLHRHVDAVTGILGMVAGGATGLVAVAGDLGADERTVVVVPRAAAARAQYLRVALVVLTMPLVVTYAFAIDASSDGDPAISSAARSPWWVGLLFLVGAIVIGTGLATLIRLPIPATLGPLILTAAIELAGGVHQVQVPIEVMPIAFIVIGWQAGLSFTRSSIAALRRIFVRTLTLMVTVIATCAGLGALLSLWTGVGALQGYLATTPGGLAAVLAVASASGSDVTFVAASQVIRLVLMLISAPLIVALTARYLRRRARRIGERIRRAPRRSGRSLLTDTRSRLVLYLADVGAVLFVDAGGDTGGHDGAVGVDRGVGPEDVEFVGVGGILEEVRNAGRDEGGIANADRELLTVDVRYRGATQDHHRFVAVVKVLGNRRPRRKCGNAIEKVLGADLAGHHGQGARATYAGAWGDLGRTQDRGGAPVAQLGGLFGNSGIGHDESPWKVGCLDYSEVGAVVCGSFIAHQVRTLTNSRIPGPASSRP